MLYYDGTHIMTFQRLPNPYIQQPNNDILPIKKKKVEM